MRSVILLLAIFPAQFGDWPRPRGQDVGADYEAAPARVREAARALLRSDNLGEILIAPQYWRKHLNEAQFKKLVVNLAQELENPETLKLKSLKGLVIAGHVEPKDAEHCWFLPQDILRVNGRAAFVLERMLGCSLPRFLDKEATDRPRAERNAREARRVILETFRWPTPARQEAVKDEKVSERVDDAIEKLLEQDVYVYMSELVDRWGREMPEPVLKSFTIALLDRLGYTEDATMSTPGRTFISGRVLNSTGRFMDDAEMLEQDVHLVNGRCAWAIERLLGCVLPSFTAATNRDPKALAARAAQSYGIVIESMTLPPPKKVEHRIKPFNLGPPKP